LAKDEDILRIPQECNILKFTDCFSTIESGIVVDLGHKDITFYAVENHKLIDTWSLGYGGEFISELLTALLGKIEKENSYHAKDIISTAIKDLHCEVAVDIKNTLQVTLLVCYYKWF
jgi:hypothetical protein